MLAADNTIFNINREFIFCIKQQENCYKQGDGYQRYDNFTFKANVFIIPLE